MIRTDMFRRHGVEVELRLALCFGVAVDLGRYSVSAWDHRRHWLSIWCGPLAIRVWWG